MSHELNLIPLLRRRVPKQNRKGHGKGCFGGKGRFLGTYSTLKVVPRSKRTEDNCNKLGVAVEKEITCNG